MDGMRGKYRNGQHKRRQKAEPRVDTDRYTEPTPPPALILKRPRPCLIASHRAYEQAELCRPQGARGTRGVYE